MKIIPIILAAGFVMSACSYSRIHGTKEDDGPSSDSKALFASALVYPEGYDWRKDSLAGNVPTKILLFKGTDSILTLTVSPDRHIDCFPDMHRIINGRLYCDFSTDSSTIISCDGVEIMSWQRRESIVDFRIKDGDIFTLGSSRNGQGWSFRKNGVILLSRNKGFLTSALYEDTDSLCFTFVESVNYNGKEAGRRYFYTCGNRVSQLVPSSDISAVHAIRLFRGQVNYLAKSLSLNGLLWQKGEETILLDLKYAEKTRAHSFIVAGGKLYAHAQRQVVWWIDTYWSNSDITDASGSAFQTYAQRDESPFFCFVYSRDGGTSVLGLDVKGDKHLFPPAFRMPYSGAFCCDDKQCCIGLNDADNNYRPFIIKGVDTLRFSFNGYFTSLYLP